MSKFRSKIWDPWLITSQIISMQFQFYSTFLFMNFMNAHFLNIFKANPTNFYSLENIFDYRLVNFKNSNNTFLCLNLIASSLISALFLWKLVNRSKQCLDFTVTIFSYHIISSWIYVGSFPSTFVFWFIIVISATAMTLLSEYLCMQSALKDIPLSLVPRANL
ncbi:SYS1 -like protein [Brachionus plicatilis]|uniref:SYS1-like protein n=1 Tax=Brachionus plicatilis TaxID=10195 RepID=A0A3M7SA84_BRAPC|nr:SYS1 -like protein [Brachionus plicatilis]